MQHNNLSPARRAWQAAKGTLTYPEKWAYARGVLPRESLPFPDFLGIGAQKAGTTWLHEMLARHPALHLPAEKEVHYFDRRFHRTFHYYTRRFRAAGDRVKGEITPDYAYLPLWQIQLIGRVMPGLRLLYVLRNPVERAWSQAQREVLRARGKRFEEVDASEFYAHFNSPESRRHTDYVANLDRWASVFPAEQLYVFFNEDLKERPRELLTEVFRHIGVPGAVDWSRFPIFEQVNHKGKVPMPEEFRAYLWELYAEQIEELYRRFGGRIAHWRHPSHVSRPAGAVPARPGALVGSPG